MSDVDQNLIGAGGADWAFCVTRIRLQGALLHFATSYRDVHDDRPWGSSPPESSPVHLDFP